MADSVVLISGLVALVLNLMLPEESDDDDDDDDGVVEALDVEAQPHSKESYIQKSRRTQTSY